MTFHPPPATLKGALNDLDVASLRAMMELLEVPTPKPTRKAEMAQAVGQRLTAEKVRAMWSRLDDTQRLAVAEAIYNGGRWFNAYRFLHKYGELPQGLDRRESSRWSPLRCFLYAQGSWDSSLAIPRDLAARIVKLVPRPPDATVEGLEECPETVMRPERRSYRDATAGRQANLVRRDMEQVAAQDLVVVLRLIEQRKLVVSDRTRQPAAATTKRIGDVLHGGDFYRATGKRSRRQDEAGPIRAFAWPWLVQAAGLAEMAAGGKLALTDRGRAAFGAPPERTLQRIWKRWLGATLLDEFSRMEEVKGQFRGKGRSALTSAKGRRAVVVDALAECPAGRWVLVDELVRFMKATGRHFHVTRDPWSLYLLDPEHGSFGYTYEGDGDELEMRYLLCFLFEYAATLGLLDVAYTDPVNARLDYVNRWGADDLSFLSRYDGLEYVRVNPLGAWCLGLADRYEPSVPAVRGALTLFTDLRVRAAAPLSHAERLLLESYAKAEAEGVWRLDIDLALSSLENGQDLAQFREFLEARDDQPLPETVEAFLRRVEHGIGAFKSRRPAVLFECADKRVIERIVGNPAASKLCVQAGARTLAVPLRSEKRFRKAAHALGYALPLK